MSDQANITLSNERLLVAGDINFVTVVDLWNDSLPLLTNLSHFLFDFSQVNSSNSAGLALLLEWIKYAKNQGKSIELQNLPQQIFSIASVAGVEHMLVNQRTRIMASKN